MKNILVEDFIQSEIKLTIGILVSNHIKYISKGLEAIKPLLDAVPSELIVVDTIGEKESDGSLAVAKEYADKIFHFDWINDFSAARNVAMDHACGEWFMYFDDDEYFDDVEEIIEFFKSGECDKYNYALYTTHDYIAPDHYVTNSAGRMVRRCKETRFEGIIHEHFNIIYGPVKEFKAFTHHFGYLYETESEKIRKRERNLILLEKEIKEKGINAWTCAHYINELNGISVEKAAKKSLEFIEKMKDSDELKNTSGQYLLLVNFRYLAEWMSVDILIPLTKSFIAENYLNETSLLVVSQIVATVSYFQKHYKEAAEWAKKYYEKFDWLQEHDEERLSQLNFDLKRFEEPEAALKVAITGLVSEAVLGNTDIAYEYYRRIEFEELLNYIEKEESKTVIKVIINVLTNLNDPVPVVEFYRRFYRDELFEKKELHKFLPRIIREKLKTDER